MVYLNSDFITADLRLLLLQDEHFFNGEHQINQNKISRVLEPGEYTLSLEQKMPLPPSVAALLPCTRFEFALYMLPFDTPLPSGLGSFLQVEEETGQPPPRRSVHGFGQEQLGASEVCVSSAVM